MNTEINFDDIAREHGRMIARIAASHEARPHLAEEVDEQVPDRGKGPEAAVIGQDGSARLMAAVRELPLVSRQVVMLTLEGFGPGEIAAAMGVTSNAVSVRLTRAKDQLRQRMGEQQ